MAIRSAIKSCLIMSDSDWPSTYSAWLRAARLSGRKPGAPCNCTMRCPSFHVTSWTRFIARMSSSQQAQDQTDHENHEKDKEQDLGDLGSTNCDPTKPEYRSDQRDNEKYGSPIQHDRLLSSVDCGRR